MNLLSLIFPILITLSLVFCALFEKQIGGARLRSSSLGHFKANRTILNAYENEAYKHLPGTPHPRETAKSNAATPREETKPDFPEVNLPCARLNLWPLVFDGKEAHPLLYQMAAQLFRTFYGKTLLRTHSEYTFLDTLLKAIHSQPGQSLQKLSFPKPADRKLYYQMIKGTKTCNLFQNIGYPPLLDYLSCEQAPSKPCLFHAHPHLTTAFFGPQVALKLHSSIHTKGGPKLTPHYLEQLCSEAHLRLPPEIFSLVSAKFHRNTKPISVFTGDDTDTQISLRKEILLNPNPAS